MNKLIRSVFTLFTTVVFLFGMFGKAFGTEQEGSSYVSYTDTEFEQDSVVASMYQLKKVSGLGRPATVTDTVYAYRSTLKEPIKTEKTAEDIEKYISVNVNLPPMGLKVVPGVIIELPVVVRNLSVSTAVYVNVVIHDAVAVNVGDSDWTLTAVNRPGPNQYSVTFNGAPVFPGGRYKALLLEKGAIVNCTLGIKLPHVITGYGPRKVKIDFFGSLF